MAHAGTIRTLLVADTTKFIRGMDASARSVMAFGKSTSVAGYSLLRFGALLSMGITVPVAFAIKKSLGEFTKVDQGIQDVISIVGDLTDENKQAMQQAADTAAELVGLAPSETIKNFKAMAWAGKDVASSVEEMGYASAFAKVAEMEQEDGVLSLIRIQKALGITSQNTAEDMQLLVDMGDKIMTADAMSSAATKDLVDALASGGAAAVKFFNIPIEEGLAWFAALAPQVKGATAGTKLMQMLMDMTNAFVKKTGSWKAAGINVYDAVTGAFAPLPETIQALWRRLSGMSEEQQRRFLTQTLGMQQRSIRPLLMTLAQRMDFHEAIEGMYGPITTVMERLEKKMQGIPEQWKRIKAAMSTTAEAIGRDFEPAIRSMLKHVMTAIQWFKKLSPEIRIIATVTAILAASIGPLVMAFGLLLFSLGNIFMTVGWLSSSFTRLAGVLLAFPLGVLSHIGSGFYRFYRLPALVGAGFAKMARSVSFGVGATSRIIGGWIKAQSASLRVLYLGALSVAGVFAGLVSRTGGLLGRAGVGAASGFLSIARAVGALIGRSSGFLRIRELLRGISTLAWKILTPFRALTVILVGVTRKLLMVSALMGVVAYSFAASLASLSYSYLAGFLGGLPKMFGKAFSAAGSFVARIFPKAFSFLGKAGGFLGRGFSSIAGVLGRGFTKAGGIAAKIFSSVSGFLGKSLLKVGGVFSKIFSVAYSTFLVPLASGFKTVAGIAFGAFRKIFSVLGSIVVKIFSTLVPVVLGILGSIASVLFSWPVILATGLAAAFIGIKQAIEATGQTMKGALKNAFLSVVGFLYNIVENVGIIFRYIRENSAALKQAFASDWGTIFHTMLMNFGTFINIMGQVWIAFGRWLVDAVRANWSEIIGVIGDLWNTLMEFMGRALGSVAAQFEIRMEYALKRFWNGIKHPFSGEGDAALVEERDTNLAALGQAEKIQSAVAKGQMGSFGDYFKDIDFSGLENPIPALTEAFKPLVGQFDTWLPSSMDELKTDLADRFTKTFGKRSEVGDENAPGGFQLNTKAQHGALSYGSAEAFTAAYQERYDPQQETADNTEEIASNTNTIRDYLAQLVGQGKKNTNPVVTTEGASAIPL